MGDLRVSVQCSRSVFSTLAQYSVHWFSTQYTGSVFGTLVQYSVQWFSVRYTGSVFSILKQVLHGMSRMS